MPLNYNDIESYLNQVFTGKKYQHIRYGRDNRVLVLFKHPSPIIKQKAELVYSESYKEALSQGMMTIEQLEKLITERNLFTKEDADKLKKLQDQLEAQYILLAKTTKVKARMDRIKGIIQRLEREKNDLIQKKSSKLLMSAETKAEEDRALYTCCNCAFYGESEELIWKSYDNALRETKLEFKDRVLTNFLIFYRGLGTSVIRELARSTLWRIRFIASTKTSESLFGVPTSEYTTDQLNLAYWSNFYQNIYEMMPEDRPSDIIIEDDDALDAFMKRYYEERNREEAARKSKKNSGGKLSAFDNEEVIVTRSNELYEDIEYDKPREAQKIKERVDLKKRTKRG
jgi:hypothetical protein